MDRCRGRQGVEGTAGAARPRVRILCDRKKTWCCDIIAGRRKALLPYLLSVLSFQEKDLFEGA